MIGQPDFGERIATSATFALLDPLIAASPAPEATAVVEGGTDIVADLVVVAPSVTPSPPVTSPIAISPRNAPESAVDPHDKLMRVRVRFLDDLLQLTGNMVMARNQLLSKYNLRKTRHSSLCHSVSLRFTRRSSKPACNRLGRYSTVMSVGAHLARELGKEVNLTVSGRDLELDRSVLDAFADPLMHLIRNAMDHGLESAEDRLAVGKSREGHLKLSALSIPAKSFWPSKTMDAGSIRT